MIVVVSGKENKAKAVGDWDNTGKKTWGKRKLSKYQGQCGDGTVWAKGRI